MSDYRAIDTEELREQHSTIADVLKEVDLTDEQKKRASDAFSEVNSIINQLNQPIEIRDREGGYHVVVEK